MYNCLIIGLGNVGMLYDYNTNKIQSHSKAINLHKKFTLSGAVDINKKKRIMFKKKYKRPAFKDIKLAIRSVKPEIIIISTPTNSHLKILTKIVNNYKPDVIICEKPLGSSLNQSLDIISLCAKNKIKLYVNFPRLSDPGVIKIKNKILSGNIKTPISGSVYYSRGTLNNASHFLNTLEFWCGKIIRLKLLDKGAKFNRFDFNSSFLVGFKNANFLFIPTKNTNSIELFSKNGRLFYQKGGHKIFWQKILINKQYSFKFDKKKQFLPSGKNKSQLHFINNLYNALNKKNNSICSGKLAIKTLRIIYSLYEK